ncbi:uncharacterized protein [Apostichopus japonicus]|uniref:uncharacterized protein n=1 Tax=Stichopus japonicus TaxID=307972 RepID=UPI003AB70C40
MKMKKMLKALVVNTHHMTNLTMSTKKCPRENEQITRKLQVVPLNHPQKFISKILLQVDKDWEMFAIDVLNISEKVVEEAVMTNDNFEDLVLETSNMQDPTNISSSDEILVSCGTRIGKVGISKLSEAFNKSHIRSDDGATFLKTLELKNVIKKTYVSLLQKLTSCKLYGARKILLFNFETDLQQLKDTMRNHGKNDWEIFAIEVLDIPEKNVSDAVQNYDTYKEQIEGLFREITAKLIGVMGDIKTGKLENKNILEFNLQYVEGEGIYYFRNLDSTQSEQSSNEEIIYQQDPPTIKSRDGMLKLCREMIGKVGIRRLLAALTKGDIETEDETNVLEKLDKDGIINKDCANLLSTLSDCKLFRARKIVFAYLEADLWNYINNHICPQISLDWEIFAVEVLKLEIDHVLDIIGHTNDEKEQILSMFRKWMFMYGQNKEIYKQILQDLINADEFNSQKLIQENTPKDTTALKVKPTDEGNCSKEFLAMLTQCSERIGVAGSKRLPKANSKRGIFNVLSTFYEAPEGILVDDSVNSLGRLCCMLYDANLLTARDVVITYIEKKLREVITTISKEKASDWNKFAWYGLSLSETDILHIERAVKSKEGK